MSTYTIATLEVTIHTYKEIAAKLHAAGYDHAFGADGTIDMQGIGLMEEKKPNIEQCPCLFCVHDRALEEKRARQRQRRVEKKQQKRKPRGKA